MATTVAEAIIDFLVERGARYIFVGPATNHQFAFIDALYDRQSEITPILVRHEAMAPLLAEGWFRATHTPGVFHVGAGPALANAVLGVMAAYACGSAVIGISGQVHTRFWGRNGMQEIQGKTYVEGHRILEPIVKRFWQVAHPQKVPEVLNQAYATAITGRPGPVLVDVPMDIFELESERSPLHRQNHLPTGRPAGDPEAVRAAFELLRAAQRPVVLCGGGVILAEAGPEVLAFAERLGVPVVTSYTGKGAIPDDHPLAGGPVGAMGVDAAMRLVQEADVILALGTRFSEHSTCGWTEGLPYTIPPTRLVQVDIEPEELGRYYPVEIGIQGDVKRVVQQLLELAVHDGTAADFRSDPRVQALVRAREAERAQRRERARLQSGLVNPHRLVAALRALLPRDAILLPDAGNNGNYFNSEWDVYQPQTYIVDRGSAAMGYAPAAALGVKLALPQRQVVAVTGDGCMTQVNWVLATAAEYGIAVKYIVLNDAALGGCVSVQRTVFDGRLLCTQFRHPATGGPLIQDFALLAHSYQVAAEVVGHNSELDDALERLLSAEGPYLLDVRIDPEARPRGAGAMVISSKGTWGQPGPNPPPDHSSGWS